MGIEFGLYHHESKEFIWLGKSMLSDDDNIGGFQIHDEKIATFLAKHLTGTFSIHSDVVDHPDLNDDTWKEVDHWDRPFCRHCGREDSYCQCQNDE